MSYQKKTHFRAVCRRNEHFAKQAGYEQRCCGTLSSGCFKSEASCPEHQTRWREKCRIKIKNAESSRSRGSYSTYIRAWFRRLKTSSVNSGLIYLLSLLLIVFTDFLSYSQFIAISLKHCCLFSALTSSSQNCL